MNSLWGAATLLMRRTPPIRPQWSRARRVTMARVARPHTKERGLAATGGAITIDASGNLYVCTRDGVGHGAYVRLSGRTRLGPCEPARIVHGGRGPGSAAGGTNNIQYRHT